MLRAISLACPCPEHGSLRVVVETQQGIVDMRKGMRMKQSKVCDRLKRMKGDVCLGFGVPRAGILVIHESASTDLRPASSRECSNVCLYSIPEHYS